MSDPALYMQYETTPGVGVLVTPETPMALATSSVVSSAQASFEESPPPVDAAGDAAVEAAGCDAAALDPAEAALDGWLDVVPPPPDAPALAVIRTIRMPRSAIGSR